MPVCPLREIQPTALMPSSPAEDPRSGKEASRPISCSPSRLRFFLRARSSPSTPPCTGARRSSLTSTAPGPSPTSFTLPFTISHTKGTYGTLLRASLPAVTAGSDYVTGLSLKLGREFTYRGRPRAYLSAGCAAPSGFPGATFPFAHVSMSFARGHNLATTLVRSCKVGGP